MISLETLSILITCSSQTSSYTAFSVLAFASLTTDPEVRRAGIHQKGEGPRRCANRQLGHVYQVHGQENPLGTPVGTRTAAII